MGFSNERDFNEFIEYERELRERVKELAAITSVTRALDTEKPLSDVLTSVIGIVSQSVQYPDRSVVRVTVGERTVATDDFESADASIRTTTTTVDDSQLSVAVGYVDPPLSSDDPFLPEERELVRTLGTLLAEHVNQRTALREHERVQDLLENAERVGSVGAWEYDSTTGEVFWTDGTRRIYDVSDDFEPTLETVIEFYHPDDRTAIEDAVSAALEDGESYELEARLITPSGETRWIRTGGRLTDDGTTIRGYIQDITQYHEASAAVEESEERLQLALEAADIGLWELDLQSADSPIRSPQHDRIFGYDDPLEDWSFERFLEHVHPDDRDSVERSFHDAFDDGMWAFECRIIRADDELRWIAAEGELFFDVDGTPDRAVGIVEDVTDRQQTLLSLNVTKQRLEAILEHTTTPMFMKARSGEYLLVNQEYLDLFDRSRDDVIGKTDFDVHSQVMAEEVWANDRRVLETGEPIELEERIEVGTDEQERTYLSSKVPIWFGKEEEEEPDAVFGVATDITTRKRYERELEETNERLEQFSSMVSHDLRNPLSLAIAALDSYQEFGDESALEDVAFGLDRIDELVTDLSMLTRHVTKDIESQSVSITSIATDAWRLIDTRSATLETDDGTIEGDHSLLKGLFENLFRNAVGHGGDDVTVRVGPLSDGFFVEDTGSGIPPDKRDQVFDHGVSTGYGGSGVGLTIVKRIADRHDLDITLTDSDEGGARFEFRAFTPADDRGQ